MSNDDEVIDLNEGFEDENEFAIDIEEPSANSKKRKISDTLGSGERDTSEIEHPRKSPKNNLEQANEWFSSFFSAADDSGSQTDVNANKSVSNNNNNGGSNYSSTKSNSTTTTAATESPRISTKHLASPALPNNPNTPNKAPTPATSTNKPPITIAPKQPTPAPPKIAIQPVVLPPNATNTAGIPVPANVVARVPSSPKQSYRFAITQQGIIVAHPGPTVLPSNNAQPQAQNTQLGLPTQKPVSQLGTGNTSANPAPPKVDPKVNGIAFRLQDTVTALAVVQKALEQKKATLTAGLQSTATKPITPIAPKPITAAATTTLTLPTTANRVNTASSNTVSTTSTTNKPVPVPQRAPSPTPPKGATSPAARVPLRGSFPTTATATTTATAPTNTTSKVSTTSAMSTTSTTSTTNKPAPAPPQRAPTPTPKGTTSPAVRVPLHTSLPTVFPEVTLSTLSGTPNIKTSTDAKKSPNAAKRPNMPSPPILKRSSGTGHAVTTSSQTTQPQAPQSVPARHALSQPQPQARALSPSPSTSPAPPQRAISPSMQQPSVPHAVPVVSHNATQHMPSAQTTTTNTNLPYHNYQDQYRRMVQQYANQFAPSQPSMSATQPTYGTGYTSQTQQGQYSSSQPSLQAQYNHSFQTQPAPYSHSNQAQYSTQQPAQYPSQSYQQQGQYSQPQFTFSSQPNLQPHSTSPNSLRVSVNPSQSNATLRTSSQQYPPHTVEVPAGNQTSYYNSFGPQTYQQHQQQQTYSYSAYPQKLPPRYVDGADYNQPVDLTDNTVPYSAGLVSSQYNSQPMNVESQPAGSTAAYDSSPAPVQYFGHPEHTTAQQVDATYDANLNHPVQLQLTLDTADVQSASAATYDQPQPAPIVNNNNTQPQPTTEQVDSKPVIEPPTTTASKEPSPRELLSNNSNSASEDDVVILDTNRKPEKPMRRSVALPPRRLVPSSESAQTRSTSPTNSDNNNNINNTSTTQVSTHSTQPLDSRATTTSSASAEPMEVEPLQQSNQPPESDKVTDAQPENQSDGASAQVNNNTERNRCMMISTARFLQRSGEVSDTNNGPQNNNPMHIEVPDADQSELNRLKPNSRPSRRQIYRTDEYWSYWSAASQSQASQESAAPYGQDEQSNRSPERDHASPAHSPDDLGQLTQQYTDHQAVPDIQIEQQQGQEQQTRPDNDLARSSEFGLTNFELDEQSYLPPNSPPMPRANAVNNNNAIPGTNTAPSISPRQHVQPNPEGFSNNIAEGNNTNDNDSTSPRIIGPLDKYFRVSPDKVTKTMAPLVQHQQTAAVPSYQEQNVITINDSQEDPSARINNAVNNNNNNTNYQWNYYSGPDGKMIPVSNTTQALNNNNINNTNNNTNNSSEGVNYSEQNQLYPPSRNRTPDNLRQSHSSSEKTKASDSSKAQQKVLLPYIADGPLVLTRIEPPPAWHGGLLWPGLGTIKQQYMELFIPNDPRIQAIPHINELPKLLMAREMCICDSQTMPTGHYCIQLISPVLTDKHSLPKAFWDPNFKAFWALKMHYNGLLLCIGPKMLERKTILCLYITVQDPTPRQLQPITCTLSTLPADMLNFFRGLNMEHYYHDFQRNGITSLYALCQITREQMETIILNEVELNTALTELRKLVMETTMPSKASSRQYSEYHQ